MASMISLQQRLVMHVLNKKSKLVFKTMGDITAQFLKDVEAADAEAFGRAQAPFEKKEVETETKPKAGVPMRSFASGALALSALPPDVKLGCVIVDEKEQKWKVTEILEEESALMIATCGEDGPDIQERARITVSQLADEFKVVKEVRVVIKSLQELPSAHTHTRMSSWIT